MLRKLLLFIFSFFCFGLGATYAQVNLVPNPSFEDYSQCPDDWDQLNRVKDWTKFNNQSPDYWNACDTTGNAGVPYNNAGFQRAESGDAYSGLIYYRQGNSREFMGSQLLTPLKKGTKYYVSYKVSPTFGKLNDLKYFCNKQCVLFTTNSYSNTNPLPVQNFAQLINNLVISDTSKWTTLKWSFIADSTYKYIVLGNFFDDTQTVYQKVNFSGSVDISYYYIDEVCVSEDSLACEIFTKIKTEIPSKKLILFPNPCQDKITVKISNTPIENGEVFVFNSQGEAVLSNHISKGSVSFSLNTDSFVSGIYFLLLKFPTETIKTVFIKK